MPSGVGRTPKNPIDGVVSVTLRTAAIAYATFGALVLVTVAVVSRINCDRS